MLPKKKEVDKRRFSNIKMDALKWLSHTQFHGANRLADKSIRWFWIPSMLFLFFLAVAHVIMNVDRYLQSPTHMLQMKTLHNKMSFPTVVICPEINFRTYKKQEFLAAIKYPSFINKTYAQKVLPQLAAFFSPDVPFDTKDLMNLEKLLQYNDLDVETAGQILTATCEEILIRCQWNQKDMNCSELFRMEITGDGFCCVFNGRSLRREMREKGVGNLEKYPPSWRTGLFGFTSGLLIAVNQTQRPLNIDLSYKWIALQASQHFVDTTINGTALNPGSEQWVTYYARSFLITEGARGLSANLRRCTMSDDGLSYFPTYKKRYCMVECEMANTVRLCHCVRMVHPRPKGVHYCDAQRMKCALYAKVALTTPESCRCPPTCDVNTNLFRTWSFKLDPTIKPLNRFYQGLNFSRVTIVRTFIQKREKITKQRWAYYTYLDLFSQLGGLFNMFFGCSILTILGLLQLSWRITSTWWFRIQEKVHRNKIAATKT
ncbi:sodium channel protein Nach-like [Anticarsia gemmatalis]|uniref:sodium channel protein Nach-like n=1 Tax=Anticarsia gemmatalis TaxID=129554 RepID=UPI003F75F880